MRISVNLATRPFVELRPLLARLRLAMGALAALAVGLGIGLHYLDLQAEAAKAKMDGLVAQTTAFQTERATNEARMRQPANQAVLERSRFLNAVFARKSFSWTAVMMDLERVLPAGVQVTSIDPVITSDGAVNIRLRVSGERERAVELVRNLERSQRFLAPRLANEAAQTADKGRSPMMAPTAPGGVEFEIFSGYNPLPEVTLKKAAVGSGPAKEGSPKTVVAKAPRAKTARPATVAPARPVQPAPLPGGSR